MNLSKLFEAQKVVRKKIIETNGLEGQVLLPNLILALQVELGELANEWRGFKHWSKKQTPVVEQEECDYCGEDVDYTRPSPYMSDCAASMCKECWDMTKEEYAKSNGEHIPDFEDYPHFKKKEPKKMLEEYADGLSFILEIGLECGLDDGTYSRFHSVINYPDSIIKQFNGVFWFANHMEYDDYYEGLFTNFLGLGEMLGFTWEQIEAAYFEKNAINLKRQEEGY